LATATLANNMVRKELAQLAAGDDYPLDSPPEATHLSNATDYDEDNFDPLILAQDLIVKSYPDALPSDANNAIELKINVTRSSDRSNTTTTSTWDITDPIAALHFFTDITVPRFFRQGTAIAYDFYDVIELVRGKPPSILYIMLLEFEKYHAVMDLFCTRRSCAGDVDRMRDAFATVEGMSEEDIDLAINVYNIADRDYELENIVEELIEEIAYETGLTESVVWDFI